MLNRCVIL
jgi:hypothetical protein